jgi:hypothetical protein
LITDLGDTAFAFFEVSVFLLLVFKFAASEQKAGEMYDVMTADIPIRNMSDFKYLWMTLTKRNRMPEDRKKLILRMPGAI